MVVRPLILVVALLATTAAVGAVYKRVAPDGSVYYSDQPEPGAKRIELPKPSTYSPPPSLQRYERSLRGKAAKKKGDKADGYKTLEIVSPRNDETLRANDGSVPVGLKIDPSLRKGDVIHLYLDGKRLPLEIDSASLVLKNVDRGTHTLVAKIEGGKAGKPLISSEAVRFTLRRTSLLFPNRRPAVPPKPAPR